MINGKNLTDLIEFLKTDDFYSEYVNSEEGLQLTIGCNEDKEFNWQTGDNSFTGGAYLYPHWAVIYVTQDSDTWRLVQEIIEQLGELMPEVEIL